MTNPLIRLFAEQGQSPWVDDLGRDDIGSGRLARLIDDGVRGLTTNPTIFERSISTSAADDEQLTALAAVGNCDRDATIEHYWTMITDDVTAACDLLADVYDASDGVDGYVSIEVAPDLAGDSAGTERAARRLHDRIDRRNLMVKIPATLAGLLPISTMIAEGRSVNATLIFGLDRYAEVIEAYLSGLESFARDPDADLSRVASVASFFVSRVDADVDRRLDEIGGPGAEQAKGHAAVAQAKLAYDLFTRSFTSERWDALEARGAQVQRLLWASTSPKDPERPATGYVDALIGPDTVTTLAPATIDAFRQYGTVERTIDVDLEFANEVWVELARLGIDMDVVASDLETAGVESFRASYGSLIDTLHAKAQQ